VRPMAGRCNPFAAFSHEPCIEGRLRQIVLPIHATRRVRLGEVVENDFYALSAVHALRRNQSSPRQAAFQSFEVGMVQNGR